MSDSNTNKDAPSMVGAHVNYVAGAVSSMLGNESGEKTKEDAVKDMRAANEQSSNQGPPAQSGFLGTVEKKAGELAGCEGMEKEGAERLQGGAQSDRVGAQGN